MPSTGQQRIEVLQARLVAITEATEAVRRVGSAARDTRERSNEIELLMERADRAYAELESQGLEAVASGADEAEVAEIIEAVAPAPAIPALPVTPSHAEEEQEEEPVTEGDEEEYLPETLPETDEPIDPDAIEGDPETEEEG